MKNKEHAHVYDENGNQICCSLEEKIDAKTNPSLLKKNKLDEQHHSHDDGHDHSHSHSHEGGISSKEYIPAIVSFVLLMAGIGMDFFDGL